MLRLVAPVLAALLVSLPAAGATPVPPGNRNVEQPRVPGASGRRTAATRSTFDAKYERIRALLATSGDLQDKIRASARRYRIDPVHIAGALVGEHTYNVDAMDRLQTYYVKAMSYLNSGLEFGYGGQTVAEFVARPEFRDCRGPGDARLWSCRERIFEERFRGRTVDGIGYPDNRFGAVFFQPYYAGQTFGLGQLNPLTALSVSDRVERVSGLPALDMRRAGAVYAAIMNPDRSLDYVAAVIAGEIEAYEGIAGFDISGNPGLTATLYNLGDPIGRAGRLAAENREREAAGLGPRWPEENYYGWLVNQKLEDLRQIFPR